MNNHRVTEIHDLESLLNALDFDNWELSPNILIITESIVLPHSITLPPGFTLQGSNKERSKLAFVDSHGIGLTANNSIHNLSIITPHDKRAIYLESDRPYLGNMVLNNLNVIGQVSLIMRNEGLTLNLDAQNIHIAACDCRHYKEQPHKYGVNVYQGAFTLYNLNPSERSIIKANCQAISTGAPNTPVLGSGVFISGYGDQGGRVHLENLTTGAVYSHSLIPLGTADIITGGIFIVYGVIAESITNMGAVVTYGVNDMVLDSWGTVRNWAALSPITSYGPSGVGLVNFGSIDFFNAQADITTHGLGARGFNQYDGSIQHAHFKSITTWGDGAVGIQISKPVGNIVIDGNVETFGGFGKTLVKGNIVDLPACAFSIKPGGEVESLTVNGDLITHGDKVTTYSIDSGVVKNLSVAGKIIAFGHEAHPRDDHNL